MSGNRISMRLRRLTALGVLLLVAPATDQSVWAIQLREPLPDSRPEPVTVFRWTRSENPAVHSYRLIIADDPNLDSIIFELPEPGGIITAPQAAVQLNRDPLAIFEGVPLFWRVLGLDQSGSPIEQSQEVFSFSFVTDQRGFTVITGLVRSDLNQLGLAGARVAVQGAHAQTGNSIVQTEFNGEYIVIALTTGITDEFEPLPIGFPISIEFTREGFESALLDDIAASERINGVITRNLTMTRDGDGDGIRDTIENAVACLNAADADSDDDGISDGQEDTNKNGIRDPGELDPCHPDTDRDGLQDGTESGRTLDDIGPDTDLAFFIPDLDPATRTDPLNPDTNRNGLLDGQEDLNHNGRVDPGETDPGLTRARVVIPALIPLLLGD